MTILGRLLPSGFNLGFNRLMQQIDEILLPVFRSLGFSLDAHSNVLPPH